MMSAEVGEAGAGGSSRRHTWDQSDPEPGEEGRSSGGDDEDAADDDDGDDDARNGDEDPAAAGNVSSEEEDGAAGGSSRKGRPAMMHSSCSSETCVPTPSCRICFQGAEQGDLLNPCRCDGSVRYTHQHCLLKWISERGCWTCELCCYRFHVIAIDMKTPWQWQSITITLVEKVQIIAVFLGSLFLVASISWLLWSALSPQAVWQRRDVLFQICYGMYGFMDLVCVGLIVHEGAAVYGVFVRWRAVNLHWDVQSYDKATDVEETSTGHSSLSPRTLWLPLAAFGPDGPSGAPTRLGPPTRPWTRLCLAPCCIGLAPRSDLGQDGDSGEVVIRVTSV